MPFKKGDPNINRKGRPPVEKTLSILIQKELDKKDVMTSKGKKITRKEAMAKVLTNMAVTGDLKAINMIYDRIEGKPIIRQEIDMDAKIDIPLIKIVHK